MKATMMAAHYSFEFHRGAVRIAIPTGLRRPQVSSGSDAGPLRRSGGFKKHKHEDLLPPPHNDVKRGERWLWQ